MAIYKALIKYGHSNFTLEILEYCDKSEVISREQYYIDLLKPEYNILPTAGSLLGFKHSEETIAKLSTWAKARFWTLEHKAKRLEQLKHLHSNKEHLERLKERAKERIKILNADPVVKAKQIEHLKISNKSNVHKEHLKRIHSLNSHQVEVFDSLTNEATAYSSITEAARAIGCSKVAISKTLKHQKEKGVYRRISDRYIPILANLKEEDKLKILANSKYSITKPQRIEVLDNLTNKITVYNSLREAERLKQLEILNSDEKLKSQKLAKLADWNKSEKAKENLKKLQKSRSVKIKIFDTFQNETIVLYSICEAARLVDRDGSVIRLVMKNIKEKGISRLINERYYVVLDDYQPVQYTNPDLRIKIEVTDTWTNKKTVYETQVEAAKAVGSVSSNIANALKKAASNPEGVSKLISHPKKIHG